MKIEDCRNTMEERAKQDPFLGVSDDTPRLDAFFSDLDSVFSSTRRENLKRLSASLTTLHQSLANAAEDMGRSRDKLAAAFDEAGQAGPEEEKALKRLSAEIDAQLLWLYQKVRLQLDRNLKPCSPKKRPVGQILEQIAENSAALVKKLPAEITLIRTRKKPVESLQGQSVFAVEKESFLNQVCVSSFSAVNRVRFILLRRRLKRRYRLVRLPVQQLARQGLPNRARQKDHRLVKAYEKAHSQATDHLEDIWRNMRFNLVVALEELNELLKPPANADGDQEPEDDRGEKLAEARKLVMDILTQTAEALVSLDTPLCEFFDELPVELELDHQQRSTSLREDLLKARLLRARLRWEFQRRLQHWRTRLTTLKNRLLPSEDAEGKEVIRSLADRLRLYLRQLLGRSGPPQESLLRLADLPSTAELVRRSKDLPPVYRRLFNIGPLKSREFLVGREEEMDTLDDILARWQQGRACSVAVTGPEGSGKTSLINCLVSEYGAKHPILRREINRRLRTERDVLDLFQEWFETAPAFETLPQVVSHLLSEPCAALVVEGGHNLLLRTLDGRKATEAFIYVLMATRKHCLWLVTFRKYPWLRMDYQLRISQYFTHHIPTLFHNDAEVREVLLLRQHTTGYNLRFSAPSDEREKSEEMSESDRQAQQKELQDKFFRQLFEASGGNIRAALYYWQMSIRFDSEENSIRVDPLGKLDYRFLRDLDRPYLFSLAEIISHGGLSISEHGEIFRLPALRSRLILDYLVQISLLETEGNESNGLTQRYTINPTFFGPVSSTLESLNILY